MWTAFLLFLLSGFSPLPGPLGASPIRSLSLARVEPPVVGVVTDSAGTPLANVQVVVEGTNRSALTGSDGNFTLRGLPAGQYHLSASLMGFAPAHEEVTIPRAGEVVRVRLVLRPSPLMLEGVIVTGAPSAANPLTVTQSTAQLSGRDLDRSLSATVAQTLASEPGIATRYAGPAASLPVIRGLTGERVLILENGQRTGDLAGSSSDHGLSIDPLAARRIEVVRGPASLLYGSSALGGVVNIIENDIPNEVPTSLDGQFALQGESASPGGSTHLLLNAPLGDSWALLLRGGGRSVGDVQRGGGEALPNTDFRNLQAEAGLGYVGERLRSGLSLGHYQFRYGLPFPEEEGEEGTAAEEDPHGHGENVHIRGHREQLKTRADLTLGGEALRDLRLDATAQWYEHDEVEESGEVGSTFLLNTQTLDLRANTGLWGIQGTVGTSAFFRQYEPSGEEALTPPANSNSVGFFLYQEVPLGGLGHEQDDHAPRLQLGGRYDLYDIRKQEGEERFGAAESRRFHAFSGSAGLNFPFSHGLSLGISVARAFRAPTVEELFANAFHAATGSFERGNPALKEETNTGLEGVLRAQTEQVSAQLAAYYNRISDYITPILAGEVTREHEGEMETFPLTEYLQRDARLRGLEGQVEVVVSRHLVLGAMGDLVRGEFQDGEPLPFMPAARLGSSLRYDNGRLSAGAELRHHFAQGRVPPGELATSAYDLLDAHLSYSLARGGRQHTLTLGADNLLDIQYREATSRIKAFAPSPGRNLSLLYRVYF